MKPIDIEVDFPNLYYKGALLVIDQGWPLEGICEHDSFALRESPV